MNGLEIPDALNVLEGPPPDAGVASLATNFLGTSEAISGDYAVDPVRAHVYDASVGPTQTGNLLLCLIDQARTSEMVNKGPYLALVNEERCARGQRRGTTVGSHGKWTVVSQRADNASPQIVRIWIPGDNDPSAQGRDMLVEIAVREGVSAARPYGNFTMNFRAVGVANGTAVASMAGTLRTGTNAQGRPEIRFINVGGDLLGPGMGFAFSESAHVVPATADGTIGFAKTQQYERFGQYESNSAYLLGFDQRHVLRQKQDAAVTESCLDRDRSSAQVWRYSLYHEGDGSFGGRAVAAGQRLDLHTGFAFTTADGAYGRVGYWGAWIEPGATLVDGATIARIADGPDPGLRAHVSPGKLIRRAAVTVTLAELQGMEFQYWGADPTGQTAGYEQYLVTVGADNRVYATERVAWTVNGPQSTPLAGGSGPNGSYDVTPGAGASLRLWSEALRSDLVHAGGSDSATYYVEETVMPGEGGEPTTLYCYDRCLKGGLTDTDVLTGNYYYPGGSERRYTVASGGGKLALIDNANGQEVRTDRVSRAALAAIGQDQGMASGELVASPVSGDWRSLPSAPLFYRWETGPNLWNRAVTVSEPSGRPAPFDRPLRIDYVHSAANDANGDGTHAGRKLVLWYEGAGLLTGLPEREDPANPGIWRIPVTLKDGVVLASGAHRFVTRTIEWERTPGPANPHDPGDTSACRAGNLPAALTSATGLTLPSIGEVGTVGFGPGDRPGVTGAPAVIEGELNF